MAAPCEMLSVKRFYNLENWLFVIGQDIRRHKCNFRLFGEDIVKS